MRTLKKIVLDSLSFFGLYLAYLNVVYVINNGAFKIIFELDLFPFFLLLGCYNFLIKKEEETQPSIKDLR